LRHRILTTFNADAEGVTPDDIINRLLQAIPTPQEEAAAKVKRA
jgi:MoxR-like ATPase